MSFILNPYRFSKKQPNTFIGGVGATITNRAQLVAKLTGIVESDIKSLVLMLIIMLVVILVRISVLGERMLLHNQSSYPTYFIHLGLYLKTVNTLSIPLIMPHQGCDFLLHQQS